MQALSALNIYDWMRARVKEGGAGLCPTVFTYTAAMRAALSAGLVDRALKVRAFQAYWHATTSHSSQTAYTAVLVSGGGVRAELYSMRPCCLRWPS